MTSTWNSADLERIAGPDELRISSHRKDGTLRPFVIIWAVRAGDSLYVRSAHGPENGWFRRAQSSGTGRIRVGGIERDVTFASVDLSEQPAVDDAYRDKYSRYAGIVRGMVGPSVYDITLRLDPAD